MLSIKHNLLAQNADRQLNINNKKKSKITEKLTSGYRINRAADDAAGLAISEKMRRQIRGLHQASENVNDGISYVKTAEGALQEVQEMLQRINQLAVQAANGTNTVADRAAINSEIQALKAEMNRVFSTTTFNEQRIWEPKESKEIIGTRPELTVQFTNTSHTFDITNENCGVIAYGLYTIQADDAGVSVKWMGYDGVTYETDKVEWDVLERNNYRFEMSDYFNNPNLYGSNGFPLITQEIAFTPNANATREDIIRAINGRVMTSNPAATMEIDEDPSSSDKGITFSNPYLYYGAAYASNRNTGTSSSSVNRYNFDATDDAFIEPLPGGGNLTIHEDKWVFSFYMDGIGTVKASPVSGSNTYFYSTDRDDQSENIWWNWVPKYENGVLVDPHYSKGTKPHYIDGTLSSIVDALTTGNTSPNNGLLNFGNNGNSVNGGTIRIRFNLTAEHEFAYGDITNAHEVGYFDLTIRAGGSGVSNTQWDTEDKVIANINLVFNNNTILDFEGTDGINSIQCVTMAASSGDTIQVPVYGTQTQYGGFKNIHIQAGAEARQYIDIEYESLNNWILGIEDTNTLTVEDASNAINEVKAALQKVSEQRSLFGAYQNRLEHTYNVNKNTEENTQESESLIRDTDVADMMMEFSINNILMQAGVSMLTQANQQGQIAMRLLQ